MKILNIKYAKNNKYILNIDENKYYFYEDVLIENNLLKPRNITKEELVNLLDANSFYENYLKIEKYALYKLRCKNEILNKIKELKITKNQDKIIELLYKKNILNDEKYLKCYIKDSINLSLKGPNLIINELIKKGFNKETIIKYINYNNDFWFIRIEKIISKKSYKNVSLNMYKEKLKKYLLDLGYDYYLFNNFIDNLNIDETEAYQKEYEKCYKRYSKKYSGTLLDTKIKNYLYQKGFKKDKQ